MALPQDQEKQDKMEQNHDRHKSIHHNLSGHEIHTRQCVAKQRKVEGSNVSVVDTPGWSTSTVENEREISRSLAVCSPGPHAFLLVLPVRMPFTKKSQQTVEELMSLFGENVWRHTIILFTEGHWLKDKPVEEYIACEGEALQELVSKCGNRYHVMVNDRSNRSQVRDLLKMIEQTVARNRGEHFTLEKNKRKPKATMLGKAKTLTEEEWNKREDELIEKMLNAAVVDLGTERTKPFPRKQQSFDHPIPSMSGESFSDRSRLSGHTLNPVSKVFQWLQHSFHARSSGYDTMSITSSSTVADMKGDSNDIPMPIARP
ncbi:putative GTPase IMAP family member 4-like [Triplophysa rosa]|uniref:GTPase IMAP family member 4-like n=1 Tax=Triplophysa rosa TaxID=992332 RepID=A0A9W7WDK7_TRIRA|nr:putative GTPase IMAP family member 4-like [Triplophysa rosa]